MTPFNLVSDAWIPVRLRSGARAIIRPADIVAGIGTEKEPVFPVWPRADLNIATLELLIGLLQVACPPDDVASWHRHLDDPPAADELGQAFSWLVPFFNLDGAGPSFMQDLELADANAADTTPIEALFIDSAGGSTIRKNADLMVKRQRYEHLSLPAAAITLYALQQFAPSGGAGHRTSMRGGGPLSTFISSPAENVPSLWQLLWANVLARNSFPPVDASRPEKIFPWLAPTLTSEKGQEVHQADPRVHPLQCFFGMPRRIRLMFVDNAQGRACALTGQVPQTLVNAYITRPHGVNYGNWQHPLTPYYKKKPDDVELLPIHPPAGRFSYEDWFAIIAGSADDTRQPARNIWTFREERERRLGRARAQVIAAGWAMSNMRPLDYLHAEQPLHLAHDDMHRKRLDALARRMVNGAQQALKFFVGAVQEALQSGPKKPKAVSTLITPLRESFFADTENRFHELLAELAEDPGKDMTQLAEQWLQALQRTALSLFDSAVRLDPGDPDEAHKIVKARSRLHSGLHGKKMRQLLHLPEPVRT